LVLATLPTLLRVGNAREGVDAIAYIASEKQLEWLKTTGATVRTAIELGDFRGKLEEAMLVYEPSAPVKRVILAGAGSTEWFGDAERLRIAVASAVKLARSKRSIKRLGIIVHEELLEKAAEEAGRDTVRSTEQALLAADMANYVYSLREKEEKPHVLEEVRLEPGSEKASETAKAIAEGVRVARDLANAPANKLNPEKLEEKARELAAKLGLTIRVLHRPELESLGMGGILAVGS